MVKLRPTGMPDLCFTFEEIRRIDIMILTASGRSEFNLPPQ